MDKDEVTLDAVLMTNMSIGKINRDFNSIIEGLTFSDDGSLLVAYTSDTLHLYEVLNAKKIKTLQNKSSQIAHLKFTHHNQAVVYAPKNPPFDIFYWSLYENEVIKSFKVSDTSEIKGLFVNPVNDKILAYAANNSLRLFDLSADSPDPIMKMDLDGKVNKLVANFDGTGTVLAIGCNYNHAKENVSVNRIELNNIDQKYNGRFLGFYISNESPIEELQFIRNSQKIACLLQNGKIIFADSINGKMLTSALIPGALESPYPQISFSPDSRFMIAGGVDNMVHVYDVESGNELSKFGGHSKQCLSVSFSPNYALFVSGCQNLIWWVPKYWETHLS